MAFTPIQYFRKEDFPELRKESWAEKLFGKLNEFTRQTQYSLAGNLSVEQNLSGFYVDIRVVVSAESPLVFYPYSKPTNTLPASRQSGNTTGFPFKLTNRLLPKAIKSITVAKCMDVTDTVRGPRPAIAFGVAWTEEADGAMVYAIGGMPIGRVYDVRLLLLCE